MKKLIYTLIFSALWTGAVSAAEVPADSITSTIKTDARRSRNFTVEGNRAFRDENYAAAEVAYRKAIDQDVSNNVARFNLAAALLRQRSTADTEAAEAFSLLNQIAHSELSEDALVEKSFYNLGNLAFNKQQYAESIEYYKNALRRNPDNDKARENLYLAQKMLQQQQDQNQNQDQNKDQNQDQNKDQNQDQNKDQNQDQNKDQNQDQNKDNKQDQNKDQNQDQNRDQQQQDKKDQPQQQRPGQISPENAQQILKAMENAENATRARIERQNAEKSKSNASRRQVANPW